MVTQSYGLTNLVMVLPIAYLFAPVVAANMIVLLGFWAGIVLMTILAYRICDSLPLAFIVGCLFVLTPAHLKNVEWAADKNATLHWVVLVHIVGVWWLRRPSGTLEWLFWVIRHGLYRADCGNFALGTTTRMYVRGAQALAMPPVIPQLHLPVTSYCMPVTP